MVFAWLTLVIATCASFSLIGHTLLFTKIVPKTGPASPGGTFVASSVLTIALIMLANFLAGAGYSLVIHNWARFEVCLALIGILGPAATSLLLIYWAWTLPRTTNA